MEDYSRITGLVSNLDTKGLVGKLIKAEQIKIDRVKADQQRLIWKQEGYREIAGMLKGFESEYFDLLNKKNDLMLKSNYGIYNPKVKVDGKDSTAVSVEVSPGANFQKISIEQIEQLASPEKYVSKRAIKNVMSEIDMDKLNASLQAGGARELTFTVDGSQKKIRLEDHYQDFDALKADLQKKLDKAFGERTFKLEAATSENGKTQLYFQANNRKVELKQDAVPEGFAVKGNSNYLNLDTPISELIPMNGSMKIDISFLAQNQEFEAAGKERPDKNVTILPSDTVKDVLNKINKGQDVAKMEFNSITGKFQLISKKMGPSGEIAFNGQETKDFFVYLGLGSDSLQQARNAVVRVNGDFVTSNTNVIEVNGAKITLNKLHNTQEEQDAGKLTAPIEIETEFDSTPLKDKFKGFIKKYNEIVDKINGMINQKKNYKYDPLTAEQKKALKDDEIKDWTEKAKEGLFRNDSGLEKILTELRNVFTDKVKGVDMTMSELGIYFTGNYRDRGKIKFDEEKFDKAMKEKPDEAIELLTNSSEIKFGTHGKTQQRYEENGIMARIKDVITKNIRTTKYVTGEVNEKGEPKYGPRGYLVEKAGIKNTSTEFTSELSMKIREINRRIDSMMDVLIQKENKYYLDFARLEKSLSQVSEQSNAFAGLM
ncbi:MAG: flagellar filament capping protein FliD [Bacillota bacterium]|nr:flagellar filament capping protein FliD [Bacillota bacterium]